MSSITGEHPFTMPPLLPERWEKITHFVLQMERRFILSTWLSFSVNTRKSSIPLICGLTSAKRGRPLPAGRRSA